MFRSLKAAALAAAVTLAAAAPAAAEVTLINVFEVPAGKEEAVIAAWETARDFLRQEPGYVSTSLHQAVTPDARFALINVAVWESAEAFRQATARMQAGGGVSGDRGAAVHAGAVPRHPQR